MDPVESSRIAMVSLENSGGRFVFTVKFSRYIIAIFGDKMGKTQPPKTVRKYGMVIQKFLAFL